MPEGRAEEGPLEKVQLARVARQGVVFRLQRWGYAGEYIYIDMQIITIIIMNKFSMALFPVKNELNALNSKYGR